MKDTKEFHSGSGAQITADHNGCATWIDMKEDEHVATGFLEPADMRQIVECLSARLAEIDTDPTEPPTAEVTA